MNISINYVNSEMPAHCPLCSRATHKVITNKLRRGAGTVHYCASCDHGFLTENIIKDAKTYYDEEYRSTYSHNAVSSRTDAEEIFNIYSQFQNQRLNVISPQLRPDHKLLEVGASAGQFIFHVRDKVDCVHAIELDTECCEFLRREIGIDCESNYLERSKYFHERYDIVCSFQVLEHVEDPVEFIRNLKRVMAPGAKAFIEVPNLRDPLLSVWDIPNYKSFYYHTAHLQYFTEASLLKVAGLAGFSPEKSGVVFTQDYNLLNHLHWIMNDQPQSDCLVGLSEVKLQGHDSKIDKWLSSELSLLNKRYIGKLVDTKRTSNILLCVEND